jgi:hypothetical protein
MIFKPIKKMMILDGICWGIIIPRSGFTLRMVHLVRIICSVGNNYSDDMFSQECTFGRE